jgi:dipeptidyl aminopeptidase/acylaminoacyl peptidase
MWGAIARSAIVALTVLFAGACPAVAEQAPPLALYGHLPGFEMASISPSGDHLAIIGRVDDKRMLVIVDAARKPLIKVPVNPDFKFRGLSWAGDQAVLIDFSVTSDLGPDFIAAKAELSSVIVAPLDGAKPWVVFNGDIDITGGVRGSYGVAQKNGRWYGYFGSFTLENANSEEGLSHVLPSGTLHPDLYEVDLSSHKHRKVARKIEGENSYRDWLLDDKGAVGAVLDVDSRGGHWTVSNGQGQRLAAGIDPSGHVSLIGFSPDGTAVVYGLRDPDGARVLFSVPIAGGTPQPFLDGMGAQNFFEDAGHRLIGYTQDNATNDGHFFDPHNDKVYKASQRAFPGLRMVLDEANTAFNRLLVTTEGPGDPETWWLVDIASGKAEEVGFSYPLSSAQVGPMKMVPYVAADGLKMEGVLTLPPDRPARGLPAVILPHGGPAAYDTVGFDWIAQAFASRGYAVFQPNFRGSTGYGAAFRAAGNGEWGRKMQTDISDGLAELVRQRLVDPKRVCIVGASYGGYAALAGVTLQHGLYRCAVAIAGIGDLARMVADDAEESGRDPMLIRNLKREIGQGRDLKAVSPIRFADTADAPVLLIHGKDDTVVHFSQSTAMADALRHAGKPVEFVTLKAEDHWLSKSDTRLQMLQASVDFVMRHDPPDAAPLPAKAN